MQTITQASFDAAADVREDEALILHKHAGAPRERVVVFVHGLGGDRYTTWQAEDGSASFPGLLFDDPDLAEHCDVAVYSYRSALRRLSFKRSRSIRTEAQQLAETIREEFSAYESVILIAHSMGGVLSKGAIVYLLKSGDAPQTVAALERIDGLFLMATPQLGALRFSLLRRLLAKLVPPLRHDEEALGPHNAYLLEIQQTLDNLLTYRERYFQLAKTFVPIWAVRAADDDWVDPLSSTVGLPAAQRRVVRGSHTDIVKPRDRSALAYAFVRTKIREVMDPPWVVQTAFGPTRLSNPEPADPDQQAFRLQGYRFFWPPGDKWVRQPTGGFPDFAITYHQPEDGFSPNVNVLTAFSARESIEEVRAASQPALEELGYEIQAAFDNGEPGRPADVLLLTMRHTNPRQLFGEGIPEGEVLYQIQRTHLRDGVEYSLTASRLESQGREYAGLDEEMQEIINSFQVG